MTFTNMHVCEINMVLLTCITVIYDICELLYAWQNVIVFSNVSYQENNVLIINITDCIYSIF